MANIILIGLYRENANAIESDASDSLTKRKEWNGMEGGGGRVGEGRREGRGGEGREGGGRGRERGKEGEGGRKGGRKGGREG